MRASTRSLHNTCHAPASARRPPWYRHLYVQVLLAVLAIFSLACSLTNTIANGVANKVGNAVTGSGDAGTVSKLWSDVPQMDGLKQENLDLPLAAKIALQAVMSAGSGGKGSMNFIAFTTTKSPADVIGYYTNDLMAGKGWNQSDEPGCAGSGAVGGSGGSSTDASSGGICMFGKDLGNNKQDLLAIFIAPDTTTNVTQVFFIRVEATITATPTP